MKLVIIGRGNVGTNLQLAFSAKGLRPIMISGHTLTDLPTDADCYIYALRDTALPEVANRVKVHARAIHVHTSGTMPLSVFGADKPHAGILYPFMTFSAAKPIPDFSIVPLFLEARNADDYAAIYSVAQMLSPRIYQASQHDRERLHVAGVLVNNFPNALYALAGDLLRGTDIPFSVLLPLIDETADKVHSLTPRQAQTGPAKRADQAVMAHHRAVLSHAFPTQNDPADLYSNLYADLYALLSQLIALQQQ